MTSPEAHKSQARPVDLSATKAVLWLSLTAFLALDGVQPGERVLVHAAAGGVGQAAVTYGRQRGADVVATAGSEAKRAWLRERGVAQVFDSRSLDFVRAGQVDHVVNCLGGEAIPAGPSISLPASSASRA